MALAAAAPAQGAIPIIDIHQHTPYSGRTADQLVQHQLDMGVSKTVLLPAGRLYGLAAGAGGNEAVWALRDRYPERFVCFANELPNIPEAKTVLEKYLKKGAIGIGEQKFGVESDSKHIELIASIAKEWDVPVLLHFQHETYNFHLENFHKILEKFPTVNFIGHAQTWWGYIDKNHVPTDLYPKTPVTPGGLSDRYLSDYPNMYGDLSAGSGRNSLARDEAHAAEFLVRHQDKLLYGSDCSDADVNGDKCIGLPTQKILRKLVTDQSILQKIFHDNAKKIMKV
ncbi:MAG: amidohydrolase family protein [Acidobacteria bacterium]|nr:amidohydrolase family protein [Acidobacteriota bacterium]